LIISQIINIVIYKKIGIVSILKLGVVIYISVFTGFYYLYEFLPGSISRLNFEKSVASVSYNYIKNKLQAGDRLVMDYQIAFPSKMGILTCGMWTGCGTEEAIDAFMPDYLIFDQEAAGGISQAQFLSFKEFVRKNNFQLIDSLPVVGDKNILNGSRALGSEILVYKRK
jgi:hypothetical protein